MKGKSKIISVLTVAVIILSCGYNLYQYNKIKNYKEELSTYLSKNIQHFAGRAGNTDNEVVYAEQYASIIAAQEIYFALSDNHGIRSDEWEYSLPGLFIQIKQVMLNDKEKFREAFEGSEGSGLMFKISDNFEDRDSINKVFKLLTT